MGISGLKTLVEQLPMLFRFHQLHDCAVVVDGNNLCHQLYHTANLSSQLGGDYDQFYVVVVNYFDKFKQCGIVPYVVFDGAHNPGMRKWDIAQDRLRKRLGQAWNLSENGSSSVQILPILVMDNFVEILRSLRIAVARNIYEADDQIASLANKLMCPVISNDSDFYIFELKGGYIPLDFIDMEIRTLQWTEGRKYSYLQCRIYSVSHLLKSYDVPGQMLPMVAVVLSCNLELPNRTSKWSFGALMTYLNSVGKPEVVMKDALASYPPAEKCKMAQLLEEIVGAYTIRELTFAKELDLQIEDSTSSEKSKLNKVMSADGTYLPQWFVESCHKCYISSFCLNAAVHGRTVLLPQVEIFSNDSNAYSVTIRLRRVVYAMLLPAYRIRKQSVLELTYVNDRLVTVDTLPLFTIQRGETSLSVPSIHAVLKLDFTKKSQFLAVVFGVTDMDSVTNMLPADWQLYICIFIYFLKNVEPSVPQSYMASILLMAIYFNLRPPGLPFVRPVPSKSGVRTTKANWQDVNRRKNKRKKSFKSGQARLNQKIKTEYTSKSSTAMPNTVEEALSHLKDNVKKSTWPTEDVASISKYENTSNCTALPLPDLRIVDASSQLQTCIMMGSYVNDLLGRPLPSIELHRFFNGFFVYKLCGAMVTMEALLDMDSVLESLLGNDTTLHWLFCQLQTVVLNNVPKTCFFAVPRTNAAKKINKRR